MNLLAEGQNITFVHYFVQMSDDKNVCAKVIRKEYGD
jgi:hypothetical protein